MLSRTIRSKPEEASVQSGEKPPRLQVTRRRKQWAPKVKTGCTNCRARHVKCDEKKPSCGRCVQLGKSSQCQYLAGTGSSPASNSLSATLALPTDIPPPDWDFTEAARYYIRVVCGRQAEVHGAVASHEFSTQLQSRAGIFLVSVADHITRTSLAQGIVPLTGTSPANSALWTMFYQYLLEAIRALNMLITHSRSVREMLGAMTTIMDCESYFSCRSWGAHVGGVAALIKLHGGVMSTLSLPGESSQRPLRRSLNRVAFANTTSPIRHHVAALSNWTRAEVYAVQPTKLRTHLFCPTPLFYVMYRFTQFRLQLYHGEILDEDALERTLIDIYEFSPEDWKSPCLQPKPEVAIVQGNMWRSAVVLYGLLSLPPTVMHRKSLIREASRMSSAPPLSSSSSFQDIKEMFTEALLTHVNSAMEKLLGRIEIIWALAVLGVAVADRPLKNRMLVERHLTRMCAAVPDDALAALRVLRFLQRFWKSGGSAWEDCFDEPCITMS